MKNMNKEKKCLVASLILTAIGFLAVIPASAVTGFWGPTTGWIIGCGVTIISQTLLFKSGKIISNQAKENGKGVGLSIIFYISRFVLYLIFFALCISMHYLVHNDVVDKMFNWSWVTCIIPLLPNTLIIAIFYHDLDEDKENK